MKTLKVICFIKIIIKLAQKICVLMKFQLILLHKRKRKITNAVQNISGSSVSVEGSGSFGTLGHPELAGKGSVVII